MAKKKNSRKVLAVALGIMGIAGLSLASASQLNITATPSTNFATGLQSFTGPCDTDGVNVAYNTATKSDGTLQYTGFVISGISDACTTAPASKLTWTLNYSTSATAAGVTTYTPAAALTAADVTIVAGTPGANNGTVTVLWTGAAIMPGSNRLDTIAITIK
jgi:hypothetical protein